MTGYLNRQRRAVILVLALAALVMAGCSGEGADQDRTRASGDAAETKVLPGTDMGPWFAALRAERAALDGMHCERAEAEAERAAQAAQAARIKKKRRTAKAAPRPAPHGSWSIKLPPSHYPLGTRDRALDQFRHFSRLWLERISRNMRFTPDKAEVRPEGGAWVARYAVLDSGLPELAVKATDRAGTPFVGVLKYLEHHYQARGETPEAAAKGPFRRVKIRRITEIFRYAGDAWVH